jgi:hypothetical protein
MPFLYKVGTELYIFPEPAVENFCYFVQVRLAQAWTVVFACL